MGFKKYILALLLLIPMGLFAQPYYFSPTGSDATGDGSIGNPWFSIGGLSSPNNYARFADPGDTVYFRGGTYDYDERQQIDVGGTQGNEIVFMAYPGETPIFDFWNWDQSEELVYVMWGFYFAYGRAEHLKLQGLHVRRLWKINTDNGRATAFYINNGVHHITFDRCKADSIAGYGFATSGPDIFYYNCDAWWCADPQDADPGNAGMGFAAYGDGSDSMQDTILYYNCRAWLCSDQGFGGGSGFHVIYDHCWAFNNGLIEEGYTHGAGHGFKYGLYDWDVDTVHYKLINNIAVYNRAIGFHENSGWPRYNVRMYNNLAAYNGNAGFFAGYTYTTNLDNVGSVYRNNLAYANARSAVAYDFWDYNGDTEYDVDHSHNSWDLPYYDHTAQTRHFNSPATVNDDDFIAVPDSTTNFTIMSASRGVDGSLPDLGDYWKLASTSDLIDIGIDVGLPYSGTAPDLGPFEYSGTPTPSTSRFIQIGGKFGKSIRGKMIKK